VIFCDFFICDFFVLFWVLHQAVRAVSKMQPKLCRSLLHIVIAI
jgi:hypothetical protein